MKTWAKFRAAGVCLPCLVACGSPEPQHDATTDAGAVGIHSLCTSDVVGDASQPIGLQIVSGIAHPVTLGDDVTLESLPAGGSGVAISVRAQNVDRCAVALRMRVEDLQDGTITIHGTLVELVKSGTGWVEPLPGAAEGFVVVPATASHSYRLTLVVGDATGRSASMGAVIRVRSSGGM